MGNHDEDTRKGLETVLQYLKLVGHEIISELEDFPGFELLEGVESTRQERLLVSAYDHARNQMDDTDMTDGERERYGRIAELARQYLGRLFAQRQLDASIVDVVFLSGWRIAVRRKTFADAPNGTLVSRDPDVDRDVHKLGTVMSRIQQIFDEQMKPLPGTPSKKKKADDRPN